MKRSGALRWLRDGDPASRPLPSVTFAVTSLLLVTIFALGGSSRGDVLALIILRPAAIAALGFGLWRLRPSHVAAHRFLFGFATVALAIPLLHLVVLPDMLWASLPGHGLVADIDRSAGIAPAWRPLSIAPETTRNAFLSGLVPLAVLVLGVQLPDHDVFRLLPVLLVLGAISAAVAAIQAVSGADIAQHLYSTSTDGSAVGLFVNRNHQALFLATMFPMLASASANVRLSILRGRASPPRAIFIALLSAACALCLIPLLLITGSRAGLVLGLAAMLTVPLFGFRQFVFDRPPRRGRLQRWRSGNIGPTLRWWATRRGKLLMALFSAALILAIVGAVLMAAYVSGRTEAFDRFRSSSIADDLRLRALPTIWSMLGHYWPIGSGVGTFEKAYFVAEPDRLLGAVFMNHAHNDWLEVVLTTGLAGLGLLTAATAAFVWRAYGAVASRLQPPAESSKSTLFVLLGLVIILLCALASLSDYPLRVPALACVFVVAALWADCRLPIQRTAGPIASDGN